MRPGNKPILTLWMLAGAFCILFANGRWMAPLAIWGTTACLLRVSRQTRPYLGGGAILLLSFVSNLLIWQGMLPLPTPLYQIVSLIGGVFFTVPFLLDRLLAARLPRTMATLVYPSAWVLFSYFYSRISPSGTFGSIAYSQTSLVLLQVVSMAGIWGLIFVIGWTASTINSVIENAHDLRRIQLSLPVYLLAMAVLLAYGTIRIYQLGEEQDRIRVAGIVNDFAFDRSIAENLAVFQQASEVNADLLFDQSRIAVEAGARVIVWQEAAHVLLRQSEPGLLERARRFSTTHAVYLGLSLLTVSERFPNEPAENKIVWITPQGETGFSYLKAFPTPAENVVRGRQEVRLLETGFGRLSSAICFDLDFPAFLREFGQAKVSLLAVPANDWREITPYHAKVAAFRAIENGFPIVRATGHGLSVAFDRLGRVLSSLDSFSSAQRLLLADVPVGHRPTVYARLGDFLPPVCLGYLLLSSALALTSAGRGRRRALQPRQPGPP